MEKFVVSARKYRPQNFNTVVGQEHITTTLKNAILHNQLAHAFLFCGPRGVGKTTCARILAKTINCENRTADGEACNTCTSCVSFDNGTSMNIHELDAASNNGVDEMRVLIDQVRFAPQAGQYKVYIIDEVHMLSSNAFNAFLKTLEEPPAHAIFILATTEKHKILPTILSRCQIFDFKRITPDDTVKHLSEICEKENIKAEKAALHIIAQKSEGCLRDSLSILDKIVSFTNGSLTYTNTLEHLNILDEDYYFRLLDQMRNQNLADVLLTFDEINQKGFEPETFLDGFSEFIRNLMVSKDARAVKLLEVAEDFKPKYKDAAKEMSSGWLLAALNILSETVIQFRQSRNKKLHIEMALIKLTYLQQAVEMIEGPGVSKKKLTDRSAAIAFRQLAPVKINPAKKPAATPGKNLPAAPKLIIEKEKNEAEKVAPPQPLPKSEAAPKTLAKIKDLHQKFARKIQETVETVPVNQENLSEMWKQFLQILEGQKNVYADWFNMATIGLDADGEVEIKVTSSFHHKNIEFLRNEFIEHFQKFFKDRTLKFKYRIEQSGEDKSPKERPLTSREVYNLLVQENPLLQELRTRLKLELD